MDGWIGHLHNRYRITGASTTSARAAARLDQLARERLPEIWAQAIDEAFGDDPTVYVIRQVETRVGLNLTTDPTDRALALSWGTRLTRSVLQTIADGEATGNLIRFADQADYVAHLAADLALGRAWERWYYFPFARLRLLGPADAIASLLGEDRANLPRVLARLHDLGQLDTVVRTLRGPDLRALWAFATAGGPADPSAFRPLFSAALALADRLRLWLVPTLDREPLFLGFASSAGQPTDWRDARLLTTAVVDALGYLADRGLIRRFPLVGSELDLDGVFSGLDWLDIAWLRDTLSRTIPNPVETKPDLPIRPSAFARGLTTRQRLLIDDLTAAITASGIATSFDRSDRDSDVLRLYAALLCLAPRWMGDPAASALLEAILAARDAFGLSRSPVEALTALSRGNAVAALHTLPEADRIGAAGSFTQVAGLGERGVELVRSLAGFDRTPGTSAKSFETRCAGVFLLIRAVLDARLTSLVRVADFPPIAEAERFPAVLLGLAARWAGEVWRVNETVDPGLMLFSGARGLLESVPFDGSTTDDSACSRFQGALLRALCGHRLIGGTTIDVRLMDYSGGLTLIASDPVGHVHPLGRLVSGLEDAPRVLAQWLELWAEATGDVVEAITCDSALAAVLAGSGIPVSDATPEDARLSDDVFRLLSAGRVGHLDIDLTLDLAAVALIRLWAAWLRRFTGSTVLYLLKNFIRRPGRVVLTDTEIVVDLEPGPLDVVLEMSGYLATVENVPWLGRRIAFRLGRGGY